MFDLMSLFGGGAGAGLNALTGNIPNYFMQESPIKGIMNQFTPGMGFGMKALNGAAGGGVGATGGANVPNPTGSPMGPGLRQMMIMQALKNQGGGQQQPMNPPMAAPGGMPMMPQPGQSPQGTGMLNMPMMPRRGFIGSGSY